MAAPVSPYAQNPDDGGLLRAYEQASSFSPITRADLESAYKPYGQTIGTVSRKATDKSLYQLASQRVVDWWKNRQAEAAKAARAAANPNIQRYTQELAAARAKGMEIGTYQQWYAYTFGPKPATTAPKPVAVAPKPVATAPTTTAVAPKPATTTAYQKPLATTAPAPTAPKTTYTAPAPRLSVAMKTAETPPVDITKTAITRTYDRRYLETSW